MLFLMISPISSTLASSANQPAQPSVRPAQPQPSKSLPQDTVSLKTAGDIDHDGDSK